MAEQPSLPANDGGGFLSNLVNVAPEAVKIEMPVEVTFAELDGTTKLPLFQPQGGGATQ